MSDPLKVLRASRVEADGAARVHLAERHLLWRGAVIGLVGRGERGGGTQNTFENICRDSLKKRRWEGEGEGVGG